MKKIGHKLIGLRLRRIRRARCESQGEVANRLGISQQLLSRIELGQAGLDQMVSACRALGVSVEIRIQGKVIPLVHAIDPLERREIEANLDWFSHLSPLDRLRTMRRQYFGLMKLRQAAMSAASSAGHGA